MTLRRQVAVVTALIAVLAVGVFAVLRWDRDEIFLVSPGSRAPDFSAATVGETPHPRRLADYRGSVVLLNIWATWCPPCVVEMPSIERLYRDFASQGLKIVAVSVDTTPTDSIVRAFVARHQLTFDILWDPKLGVAREYQTTGFPETFVIGRDGVIRKKVIGASDWDSPGDRALIAQLLREPAS